MKNLSCDRYALDHVKNSIAIVRFGLVFHIV